MVSTELPAVSKTIAAFRTVKPRRRVVTKDVYISKYLSLTPGSVFSCLHIRQRQTTTQAQGHRTPALPVVSAKSPFEKPYHKIVTRKMKLFAVTATLLLAMHSHASGQPIHDTPHNLTEWSIVESVLNNAMAAKVQQNYNGTQLIKRADRLYTGNKVINYAGRSFGLGAWMKVADGIISGRMEAEIATKLLIHV